MDEKERKIELQEIVGPDEARARISIELSHPDSQQIKMFSDLFIEEIPHTARFLTIAERADLKTLKAFIDNFLTLRISLNRLGRMEMAQIAMGVIERPKGGKASLFDFLQGIR